MVQKMCKIDEFFYIALSFLFAFFSFISVKHRPKDNWKFTDNRCVYFKHFHRVQTLFQEQQETTHQNCLRICEMTAHLMLC